MLISWQKKKSVALKSTGKNGHYKINRTNLIVLFLFCSLPGPEKLNAPGNNNGQIIMINENGKPICYKWLSDVCRWEKIGDVLSAADPNKNMHEGKVVKLIFFFYCYYYFKPCYLIL